MRSRCLDIGQILFCDFLWTETKLRFLKTHKKEWGWYPTIMTKQAWSIKDKFYSKKISLYQELRMTCLIGEPWKKGNCVCNTIKPGDWVVCFDCLLLLFATPSPTLSKVTSLWVCSVQHFSRTGTKQTISSKQNEVANQNTGFPSYSPWALPVMC